jgi:hypothetical protein
VMSRNVWWKTPWLISLPNQIAKLSHEDVNSMGRIDRRRLVPMLKHHFSI